MDLTNCSAPMTAVLNIKICLKIGQNQPFWKIEKCLLMEFIAENDANDCPDTH